MPLHLGDDVTVTCFLFERTQSGTDPRGSFLTEIKFELVGKYSEKNGGRVVGTASFASLGGDHASPLYLGFKLGSASMRMGVGRVRGSSPEFEDMTALPLSSIAHSMRAYYEHVSGRMPTSFHQKAYLVNESETFRFRRLDGIWTMLADPSDNVGGSSDATALG